MKKSEIVETLIVEINEGNHKWRTVKGLARKTKLPPEQLRQILQKSDKFVRAKTTDKSGSILYTTREKYVKETSLFRRAINAAANTAGE